MVVSNRYSGEPSDGSFCTGLEHLLKRMLFFQRSLKLPSTATVSLRSPPLIGDCFNTSQIGLWADGGPSKCVFLYRFRTSWACCLYRDLRCKDHWYDQSTNDLGGLQPSLVSPLNLPESEKGTQVNPAFSLTLWILGMSSSYEPGLYPNWAATSYIHED